MIGRTRSAGGWFRNRCNPIGLLVLSSVLTACVPYPHKKVHAPIIDGQLLEAGQPLADVAIYLHRWREDPTQCSASAISTRTDAQGRFHFAEQSEQRWVVMPGTTMSTWALCIESRQRLLPGWFNAVIRLPDSPVALRCDVATADSSPFGLACQVDDNANTPASP